MSTRATMTNEGRQALITYCRNSAATSQTNKFFIKSFKLFENQSGNPSQTTTLATLNADLILDATFDVASRTEETGNILRIDCVVTPSFSTVASLVTAIGVVFEEENNDNIVAVTTGTKLFKVAGDSTAKYSAGSVLSIEGSTGNDGEYTVSSSAYVSPNTEITVVETVPSAVADGAINKLYLFAYTIFDTGFNKIADTSLSFDFDIQF